MTSNRDTTGAKRLIEAQQQIISEAMINITKITNYANHIGKNLNKALCNIHKSNSTYCELGELENGQITAIG